MLVIRQRFDVLATLRQLTGADIPAAALQAVRNLAQLLGVVDTRRLDHGPDLALRVTQIGLDYGREFVFQDITQFRHLPLVQYFLCLNYALSHVKWLHRYNASTRLPSPE